MRFPSMDEIDPELEEKFQLLSHAAIKRDSAAAEKNREMFLSEVQNIAVSNPPVPRLTFQSCINNLIKYRKVRFKMTPSLTSLIMAVLLFFGGSGAGVAAAQSSLPDDTLYPVKVLSEQITETLTFLPEKKLDLAMDLSEKRLDEISKLIENGTVPKDETLARLQEYLEKAIKLSNETGKTDTKDLVKLMDRLQEEMKRMEKLPSGINPPPESDIARAREKMQSQIKMVDEKVKAPVQNSTQQQEHKPGTVPSPMPTIAPNQNPAANPNPNLTSNQNPDANQNPAVNLTPETKQNPSVNQASGQNPDPKGVVQPNPTQLSSMPTPMPVPTLSTEVPNGNPNNPQQKGIGQPKDNRFMLTPMPTPAS